MDPLSKLQYACKTNGPELLLDLSSDEWTRLSQDSRLDRVMANCLPSEEILVLLLRHSIVTSEMIHQMIRQRFDNAYLDYLRHLLLQKKKEEDHDLLLWLKHWYLSFDRDYHLPLQLLHTYHYNVQTIHQSLVEWLTAKELELISQRIYTDSPSFFLDWLRYLLLGIQYHPARYSQGYKLWIQTIQDRLLDHSKALDILSAIQDPELFRMLSREIHIDADSTPSFAASLPLMCPTALEDDIREIAHRFSHSQLQSLQKDKDGLVHLLLYHNPLKVVRLFYTPFDSSDIYKILVNTESPSRFKSLFCSCCAMSKPVGLHTTERWNISKRIQEQYCTQASEISMEIHLPANSIVPGMLWIMPSLHLCDNALLSKEVWTQWIRLAERLQMVLFHEGTLQECPCHANAYLTSDTSFTFSPEWFQSIEEAYERYLSAAKPLLGTTDTLVWQCRVSSAGYQLHFQTIHTSQARPFMIYSLQAQVISPYSLSMESDYVSLERQSHPEIATITSWNYLEMERRREQLKTILSSVQDPNLFSIYCTKIVLAFKDWPSLLQPILFSSTSKVPLSLLQSLLPTMSTDSCLYSRSSFAEWLFYTLSSRIVGFLPKEQADSIFQITSARIQDVSSNGYVVQTKVRDSSAPLAKFLSHVDLMIKAQPVNVKTNAEIRAGYLINKLRLRCPHFILTLGYIRCPALDPFSGPTLSSLCSTTEQGSLVNYILLEWIPRSRSFSSFFKPSDQASEQQAKTIYNLFTQTLAALSWSHQYAGFTHYDLHLSNLLCQSTSTPDSPHSSCHYRLVYPQYSVIVQDWFIYFIDYEYSYIQGVPKQKRLSPRLEQETGVTSDRPALLADLFTLSTRLICHMTISSAAYLLDYSFIQQWLEAYVQLFAIVFPIPTTDALRRIHDCIRSSQPLPVRESMLRQLYRKNGNKYWFLRLSLREEIERTVPLDHVYQWIAQRIQVDPLSQDPQHATYTEITIPRM